MSNIWIFAGTTEGRKLAELALAQEGSENRFFVSVATEYGKQLIPEHEDKITVFSGRLSEEEMEQKIKEHEIAMAVDATHPYAVEVSRNIKNACAGCDISYVRLLREESRNTADCITVPDAAAAADFLNREEGKALLTTGSKELELFTKVQNYRERLYPRILSTTEMVEKAISLGFDPSHLICMQGPFSYEMNRAMLLHTDASYLVTKESGRAGGFDEKLRAAEDTGVKVILIQRPEKEEGVSFVQACRLCGLQPEACGIIEDGIWFPLFIKLEGKRVLVAGAGKIASRRIQVLRRFGCRLTVIAPKASGVVMQMAEEGKLIFHRRIVRPDDIQDMDIVLAATDCRAVNLELGEACRKAGILFNTADCREECDFYFPGVIQNGSLIAGVTAGGTNHRLVAAARRKIEQALGELQES